MSLIVKRDKQPPKSLAKCDYKELAVRRSEVNKIVTQLEENKAWDSMQAKDVPSEITEHVIGELERGSRPSVIRQALGISRQTDKKWQKILASIRQGTRVDSVAMFRRWMHRNENLSTTLFEMLQYAAENAKAIGPEDEVTQEGREKIIRPTGNIGKDFATIVDSVNKLQMSTVKMGKDLGVFTDGTQGSGSGTTIVIENKIPIPSQHEIDEFRAMKNAIPTTKVSDEEIESEVSVPESE